VSKKHDSEIKAIRIRWTANKMSNTHKIRSYLK